MNTKFRSLAFPSVLCMLAAGSASAEVQYFDKDTTINSDIRSKGIAIVGYGNDFDYGRQQNPSSPTITLSPGGVGEFSLYNSSRLKLVGGDAGTIGLKDNSTADFFSGTANGFGATGHSTVNLYDYFSLAGYPVFSSIRNDSTLNMRGGDYIGALFAGGNDKLSLNETAHMNLFGGDVSMFVDASSRTTINLIGTTIEGRLTTDDFASARLVGGTVKGYVISDNNSSIVTSIAIGGGITTHGMSTLTLLGGSVGADMNAYEASTVLINGGEVTGNLNAYDDSKIIMSGGHFDGFLTLSGNSTLLWKGGSFGNNGFGPQSTSLSGLYLYDSSTLNIVGFGLGDTLLDTNYNGLFSEYRLFGDLLDGTNITGDLLFVENRTGASFSLTNQISSVPEPGSVGLLGSLYLAGMLFAVRRRRG